MQEEIDRLISWYKNEITKLVTDRHSNPVALARIEAYEEFIFDLQSLTPNQDRVKEFQYNRYMSSSAKSKGSVATVQWWKHLRKYWKRVQNKRVRVDGKKQTQE